MGEWFSQHAVRHCTPKTVERYRQLADDFLPTLEHVKLSDLSALMIERELNRLKDAGGHDRKKKAPRPLSAKTVCHVAGVLGASLSTAVRWKLIKVNPMAGVQLPKVQKREARALDTDQTEWFLDGARGSWLYPFLVLEAATGARRGELLALAWPDVNLDSVPPAASISKSLEQTREGLRIKPPKNEKTRSLPLPAIAVEALRAHRAQQDGLRRDFGPDYRADLNLIFATPEGSHGSQLLSEGVPLPTVSKRLGHSSPHVTATIYSHAFTGDEVAAAEAWDSAMRKAQDVAKVRQ